MVGIATLDIGRVFGDIVTVGVDVVVINIAGQDGLADFRIAIRSQTFIADKTTVHRNRRLQFESIGF